MVNQTNIFHNLLHRNSLLAHARIFPDDSRAMENLKRRIVNGELKTVKNTRGKANFWAAFQIVTTLNDEPTSYAQCTTCKAVLSYDSKKTGSSHLQRHFEHGGCSGPGSSSKQTSVSDFLSKATPSSVKSQITVKCVNFCCMDIRPFETVAGNGFIKLAQELINVGATHQVKWSVSHKFAP